MKKEIGILILLVVLCAVTGVMNPRFFSQANLGNTANIIGLFGIFSLGAGLVIITSGIDLSVGSMIALIGMLLVMALTDWHWAWPLAVLFVARGGDAAGLGARRARSRVSTCSRSLSRSAVCCCIGALRGSSRRTHQGIWRARQGFETSATWPTANCSACPCRLCCSSS